MEGAKIVIDNKFHIGEPKAVLDACKRYKNDNDWLKQFIDECCARDKKAKVSASDLYTAYVRYALARNEYKRPGSDFKKAMETAGFISTHPHNKVIYHGIRLLNEFEIEADDEPILTDEDVEAFIEEYLS